MRWVIRELTRLAFAFYAAGCAFDAALDGDESLADTRSMMRGTP